MPIAEEQGRRVGDFAQAGIAHLEDTDFVGGPEAVLGAAQDAERIAALALKRQDGIDHMLNHTRAGNLAFLGDVADHDDRGRLFLGEPDQFAGAGADLRHRALRRLDRIRPQGLDGINDNEIELLAF